MLKENYYLLTIVKRAVSDYLIHTMSRTLHIIGLQCKAQPEEPLYQGGILKDEHPVMRPSIIGETTAGFYTPAFVLKNLTQGNIYCFSS